MNKTIFFILDSFELYSAIYNKIPKRTLCYSYFDTEEAIKNNLPHIVTYDIGHLSFDLEDLGYTIFIGYKGHSKQFYTGMSTANGKELRKAHNLRRLLIGGALDNDLHINRNKFYYDTSISTSDLCQQETNFQRAITELAINVAHNTIGFELGNGVKAMTPEESKAWHETHSYYDKDGHFYISDEPIEYDGINKIKPEIKI